MLCLLLLPSSEETAASLSTAQEPSEICHLALYDRSVTLSKRARREPKFSSWTFPLVLLTQPCLHTHFEAAFLCFCKATPPAGPCPIQSTGRLVPAERAALQYLLPFITRCVSVQLIYHTLSPSWSRAEILHSEQPGSVESLHCNSSLSWLLRISLHSCFNPCLLCWISLPL